MPVPSYLSAWCPRLSKSHLCITILLFFFPGLPYLSKFSFPCITKGGDSSPFYFFLFHFAYLCLEGSTGIQEKNGETKKSPHIIKIQRWSVWSINPRSLNTNKIFVISAFIERLQNKLCISQTIQKLLSFLICFLFNLHRSVQKNKIRFLVVFLQCASN